MPTPGSDAAKMREERLARKGKALDASGKVIPMEKYQAEQQRLFEEAERAQGGGPQAPAARRQAARQEAGQQARRRVRGPVKPPATDAGGGILTRRAPAPDLPLPHEGSAMNSTPETVNDGPAAGPERVSATVAQLEEEGDIAADYLEGLLDIADIDGDLEMDVRAGPRVRLGRGPDGDALRLIADPDTVQALQELTRLAVQSRTGRFSRLILDVGGSRDARQQELEDLVDRADRAARGGRVAGVAARDVELRAQARARHRRGSRLRVGVVRRGRRPPHRHQPRLTPFHVKRR